MRVIAPAAAEVAIFFFFDEDALSSQFTHHRKIECHAFAHSPRGFALRAKRSVALRLLSPHRSALQTCTTL